MLSAPSRFSIRFSRFGKNHRSVFPDSAEYWFPVVIKAAEQVKVMIWKGQEY
jgi:hypothetical protein